LHSPHNPIQRLDQAAEQLGDTLAEQVPESIRAPMRTPVVRRIFRWLWRLLLFIYFVFVALVIALRYWVMPEIASYRPEIEAQISRVLERPVSIGALDTYWIGLRPALRLRDLVISDTAQQPALQLANVEAHLGWDSFVLWQLRLSHLEITAPELSVQRTREGRLLVAGIAMTPDGDTNSSAADWLLAQHSVVIRNAHVRWHDESRGAPVLEVPRVQLRLENAGRKHRLGLKAEQLAPLASSLDLRAELLGRGATTWREWSGEIYLNLENAHIDALRPWFDPPAELSEGNGSLRIWMDFADQSVRKLTADMRLQSLRSRLGAQLPTLALRELTGRVVIEHHRQATSVTTENLQLLTTKGLRLPPTNVDINIHHPDDTHVVANASINTLDLESVASIASHLPLPTEFATSLQQLAPRGRLTDLRAGWSGSSQTPERWNVSGRVEQLWLKARGVTPGVQNISGQVLGDQDSGRLTLTGSDTAIDLPEVFADPVVPLGKLDAVIEWNRNKKTNGAPVINLRRLTFENRDVAGTAKGLWYPVTDSPAGQIDLSAQITRANGTAIWRYMPLVAGNDAREWLRDSILGGQATQISLALRGKLYDFPFRDPAQGSFEVRGRLNDVRLDYAPGWPVIDNIQGQMLFNGAGMLISIDSARSLEASLSKVQAQISDLSLLPTPLVITGTVAGPTSEFLRFIEASPVSAMLDHATRPMLAQGNGQLDLGLFLPLEEMDNSRITGAYRFDSNTMTLDPELPPVTGITGQLNFTGDSLSSNSLSGTFLGGPIFGRIKTENSVVSISTGGEIRATHLREVPALATSTIAGKLSGSSKWNGTVRIGSKGTDMVFASSLIGLGSTLPAPLAKTASESLPARYERKPLPKKAPLRQVGAGNTAILPAEEVHELSLGKQISGQLIRQLDAATDHYKLVRGAVSVGRSPLRVPERDVLVTVDLPLIDLDAWTELDTAPSNALSATPAPVPPVTPASAWPASSLELRTDKLTVRGRDFGATRLSARRSADSAGEGSVHAEIRGSNIAGALDYREQGTGRLTGTLSQLTIPEAHDNGAAPPAIPPAATAPHRQLPVTDLTIERFAYKQLDLGQLKLNATSKAGLWDARLSVRNPDITLDGTIRWAAGDKGEPEGQTHTEFRADAKSLEHGFERLGFPGTLRRGAGNAQGKLSWAGAPTSVDFASLAGNFEIEARDGQFNKLEPGVGRLLGILSLQSIPRRITFDFRDLFSQGFAFDKIAGDFAVRQGVMTTDNLEVRGPAAKVVMRGQIDLGHETQNLSVRIQPALGDSLTVGTMIANPVIGAAVWATQKLFSDPLDRAFAYDYSVTGSWGDPKVDKQGTIPPLVDKPKEASPAK
jgi:uncharacterized protein (TIGR02099 family)